MLSFAYRLLTDIGAPVIALHMRKRRRMGREDQARFPERLGSASTPRPKGRLIWCHAASVGEAVSLLTLIEALRAAYPETHILMTTGTVTSAKLLAARAPEGVIHQYVPIDRVPYIRKFLDHWQPDLALWVESDLWPNMLAEIKAQMIPAVLLNGQMSEKSFRNWYRVKGWARQILSTFSLCLTQTEDVRGRLVALGASPVKCIGNLKYAGRPLPVKAEEQAALKQKINGRAVWLMAQTHRGEEDIAISSHKALRDHFPDLLTIIVPRHPHRGDEITALIESANLHVARRSLGQPLVASTDIYLADTLGELGLFYSLAPIAVVGGSFAPMGCHNLIEPAQLGNAIIFGPSSFNCAEIAKEFTNRDAAIQLRDANELNFTLRRWLAEPAAALRYAHNARALAAEKRHVLDEIVKTLSPWLVAASDSAGAADKNLAPVTAKPRRAKSR